MTSPVLEDSGFRAVASSRCGVTSGPSSFSSSQGDYQNICAINSSSASGECNREPTSSGASYSRLSDNASGSREVCFSDDRRDFTSRRGTSNRHSSTAATTSSSQNASNTNNNYKTGSSNAVTGTQRRSPSRQSLNSFGNGRRDRRDRSLSSNGSRQSSPATSQADSHGAASPRSGASRSGGRDCKIGGSSEHHRRGGLVGENSLPAVVVRGLPIRSNDRSIKDGLFDKFKKHGEVMCVEVIGEDAQRYALITFQRHTNADKIVQETTGSLFSRGAISVTAASPEFLDSAPEDNERKPLTRGCDQQSSLKTSKIICTLCKCLLSGPQTAVQHLTGKNHTSAAAEQSFNLKLADCLELVNSGHEIMTLHSKGSNQRSSWMSHQKKAHRSDCVAEALISTVLFDLTKNGGSAVKRLPGSLVLPAVAALNAAQGQQSIELVESNDSQGIKKQTMMMPSNLINVSRAKDSHSTALASTTPSPLVVNVKPFHPNPLPTSSALSSSCAGVNGTGPGKPSASQPPILSDEAASIFRRYSELSAQRDLQLGRRPSKTGAGQSPEELLKAYIRRHPTNPSVNQASASVAACSVFQSETPTSEAACDSPDVPSAPVSTSKLSSTQAAASKDSKPTAEQTPQKAKKVMESVTTSSPEKDADSAGKKRKAGGRPSKLSAALSVDDKPSAQSEPEEPAAKASKKKEGGKKKKSSEARDKSSSTTAANNSRHIKETVAAVAMNFGSGAVSINAPAAHAPVSTSLPQVQSMYFKQQQQQSHQFTPNSQQQQHQAGLPSMNVSNSHVLPQQHQQPPQSVSANSEASVAMQRHAASLQQQQQQQQTPQQMESLQQEFLRQLQQQQAAATRFATPVLPPYAVVSRFGIPLPQAEAKLVPNPASISQQLPAQQQQQLAALSSQVSAAASLAGVPANVLYGNADASQQVRALMQQHALWSTGNPHLMAQKAAALRNNPAAVAAFMEQELRLLQEQQRQQQQQQQLRNAVAANVVTASQRHSLALDQQAHSSNSTAQQQAHAVALMRQQQQLALQQPQQQQAPPAASGNTFRMLVQRYPIVWRGHLALKNDQAFVQMHFISGNQRLPPDSLPTADAPTTPILRVEQRVRLELQQLEGVALRMQNDEDHCLLLALPCGRDQPDIIHQSSLLQSGFITYLQQKQAAGIVNVSQPNDPQPAFVVHIFPPCDFASKHFITVTGDFHRQILERSIPFLLIVVATCS